VSERLPGGSIPYSELLQHRSSLDLLAATPDRIASLVRGWNQDRWSRSYAAGKWSAAQIVLHLAQDEIGWSGRIRFALTVPGFVPTLWDGADWVVLESPTRPEVALEAFLTLRRLNLLLYRRLTSDQLHTSIPHPEFGHISVEWILTLLAGHDLHHFNHLQVIAEQ